MTKLPVSLFGRDLQLGNRLALEFQPSGFLARVEGSHPNFPNFNYPIGRSIESIDDAIATLASTLTGENIASPRIAGLGRWLGESDYDPNGVLLGRHATVRFEKDQYRIQLFYPIKYEEEIASVPFAEFYHSSLEEVFAIANRTLSVPSTRRWFAQNGREVAEYEREKYFSDLE